MLAVGVKNLAASCEASSIPKEEEYLYSLANPFGECARCGIEGSRSKPQKPHHGREICPEVAAQGNLSIPKEEEYLYSLAMRSLWDSHNVVYEIVTKFPCPNKFSKDPAEASWLE
jgi:hypothetical protein